MRASEGRVAPAVAFAGARSLAARIGGRTDEQATVINHVRQLLGLRRELEPLRRGDYRVLPATQNAWACVRKTGEHLAVILINNGPEPLSLELSANSVPLDENSSLRERLPGGSMVKPEQGKLRFNLPARSSAVYSN